MMLAVSAHEGLELRQFDSCTAFLNWELQEEVYLWSLAGAEHLAGGSGRVLRLRRVYQVLQRGTRDTPNSMGERQRAEAKHKQTQATQATLTRERPQTHPHKSAKATGKQATADNLRPPRPRDKRGRATGPGQTPWQGCRPAQRRVYKDLQRETKEKARHPETKHAAVYMVSFGRHLVHETIVSSPS
jgi:hypothetical protein